MSEAVMQMLQDKFGDKIISTHSFRGDYTALVADDIYFGCCQFLKEDSLCDFDMLTDLTAVDYPGDDLRFEVVCHLYSISKNHRFRIKSRIPDANPRIESLTSLYNSANWFEREVYDMFGIIFANHPDLRRLLLYPEFEGYPLRKDYPLEQRQHRIKLRHPEVKIQG